jgi:lantibiotic transport system permease protein
MTDLFRALSAELLKTRRTLALVLTILAPLSLAFLEVAIGFDAGTRMYRVGGDSWMTLIEHTAIMWTLLLLPLFITLEMGLLGAQEHNHKTWKQLYALPLPRWTIYIAKQLVGMGVIGLSMLVLGLMTVGVGLIGRVFLPKLGFDAPIPWMALMQNLFLSYLASWLMISIHIWISLRWSSFVLAMATGIVPTVCGVVMLNSKWVDYDPWLMPGVVAHGLAESLPFTLALTLGIVGGIVIALLGCWETTQHDIF